MLGRQNLLLLPVQYTLFVPFVMLNINPEMRKSWRRVKRKLRMLTGSLKGRLPSARPDIEVLLAKFPANRGVITQLADAPSLCPS